MKPRGSRTWNPVSDLSLAALIADLAKAGVDPDLIGRVAEAVANREPIIQPVFVRDEQALRRREKDRDRKRVRGIPQKSADSAELPLETKGSPKPLPKTQSEDPPSPPKGGSSPILAFPKSNGFARFWEAYPRKQAKGAAERAYAKAVRQIHGPDPPGLLLAALERVKPTWSEPQFIPHAATWLNDRRWEDEPETQDARRPDPRPSDAFVRKQANLARSFAGAISVAGRSDGYG